MSMDRGRAHNHIVGVFWQFFLLVFFLARDSMENSGCVRPVISLRCFQEAGRILASNSKACCILVKLNKQLS